MTEVPRRVVVESILLTLCFVILLAGSRASALCWRLPPWKCDEWTVYELDIPRQRAQARCRFAELTSSDEAAFEKQLDALMEGIREGVAKTAAETGRDPEDVLLDFISSPIVAGTEEDIVPYLVDQCRLDLALHYVAEWLPRQIGLGDRKLGLFDVYPIGAHAHNDYEHESPLFNAMLLGFDSIEADIYALEKDDIKGEGRYEAYLSTTFPGREPPDPSCRFSAERLGYEERDHFFVLQHTPPFSYGMNYLLGLDFEAREPHHFPEFEDYYLRPLSEFACRFEDVARVRKPEPLRILVDFKRGAYALFDPFQEMARRYKEILTWFEWKPEKGYFVRHEGFVQLVISGFDTRLLEFRPKERIFKSICQQQADRFVFLDGRVSDDELRRRFETECGVSVCVSDCDSDSRAEVRGIDFDLDIEPMVSTKWKGVSGGEIEDILELHPGLEPDGSLRWRPLRDGERQEMDDRIAELALELNREGIEKAHGLGQEIRIYGAPKLGHGTLAQKRFFREIAWDVQYQACVDIINTDDLRGLYWFLVKKMLREKRGILEEPACRETSATGADPAAMSREQARSAP